MKTAEPEGYGEKARGKKRKGEEGGEKKLGEGAGRKGALDAWVKKGEMQNMCSRNAME